MLNTSKVYRNINFANLHYKIEILWPVCSSFNCKMAANYTTSRSFRSHLVVAYISQFSCLHIYILRMSVIGCIEFLIA